MRESKRIPKPSFLAQCLKEDLFEGIRKRKKPQPSAPTKTDSLPALGKREMLCLETNNENPTLIVLKKIVKPQPTKTVTDLSPIAIPILHAPSKDHPSLSIPTDLPNSPSQTPITPLPAQDISIPVRPVPSSIWHRYYQPILDNIKEKTVFSNEGSIKLVCDPPWAAAPCEKASVHQQLLPEVKLSPPSVPDGWLKPSAWKDVKWIGGGTYGLEAENLGISSLKDLFSDVSTKAKVEDPLFDLSVPGEIYTIVDNQNKDMPIRIRDAARVLMLPTSDTPSSNSSTHCVNSDLRSILYRSVPFSSIHTTQYEPATLQSNNEDNPKRHFIKQKLSQANLRLKRTFGISYIKQCESRQSGVSTIYAPIPPMVIQCSTLIDPHPPGVKSQWQSAVLSSIHSILTSPITVNVMSAPNETTYRGYLLSVLNSLESPSTLPSPPLDMCTLSLPTLSSLAYLLHPNLFILLPLSIPCVYSNILIFGLHMKRSLNSKKSYLHNIGKEWKGGKGDGVTTAGPDTKALQEKIASLVKQSLPSVPTLDTQPLADGIWDTLSADILSMRSLFEQSSPPAQSAEDRYLDRIICSDGLNFNTLSIKLEMYIPENTWKGMDIDKQRDMTTFIHLFKQVFDQWLLQWSVSRERILQEDPTLSTFPSLLHGIRERLHPHPFPSSLPGPPTHPAEYTSVSQSTVSMLSAHPSSFSLPLYTVDTRDSFCLDPIAKVDTVKLRGREVIKTDYYFHPNQLPSNFDHFKPAFPDGRIGVVTYENVFSEEELKEIEELTHRTELEFFRGGFLPHTGQATLSGHKVKRTKFFFGSRYMWTAQQLAEPHSSLAAGIRTDVSPIPGWMVTHIEDKLVDCGIIPQGFVNSMALNVYHDGEEGLGQHFDDAVRFRQPIFSLRVFSDARLSFGSQLYNYCNGAFSIPMSRGCVTVMEEGSFAANGIKHCIRPVDMSGKSAAFILRQMHTDCVKDALLYDRYVDLPLHLSTLNITPDSKSYAQMLNAESEYLLKKSTTPT